MLIEKIQTLPQYLVPQHILSRFIGVLTNCQIPTVKNWCIKTFINRYGVDMSTAVNSDPFSYSNFNSFFTRTLKPGARQIAQGDKVIACPADGIVSQAGAIYDNRIFQAKGFDFNLQQLLGGQAKHAAAFQNGHFATIYLAPKDYHRVHMPVTGHLTTMIYVPGRLFSVNPRTTRTVPGLFARNERVVCLFDTEAGPMAVILVGAMLVASINVIWAGEIAPGTNRSEIREWNYAQGDVTLKTGDELGHFKLGSTVMVLFGSRAVQWVEKITANQAVRMGELMGNIA